MVDEKDRVILELQKVQDIILQENTVMKKQLLDNEELYKEELEKYTKQLMKLHESITEKDKEINYLKEKLEKSTKQLMKLQFIKEKDKEIDYHKKELDTLVHVSCQLCSYVGDYMNRLRFAIG